MPGTLMHIAFGKMVYELLGIKALNKTEFLLGNLLPDEALDKDKSHYRLKAHESGYLLPDLASAEEELFKIDEPLKLGAYSHLYFDFHLLKDKLFDSFLWQDGYAISKRNGMRWTTEEFFSREVFYTSYGELNSLFIRDGLVDLEEINRLPEPIPTAGIEALDTRRAKTWRRELFEFLSYEHKYTGTILDYGETVQAMKQISSTLAEKIRNII